MRVLKTAFLMMIGALALQACEMTPAEHRAWSGAFTQIADDHAYRAAAYAAYHPQPIRFTHCETYGYGTVSCFQY